MSLPAKSMQVLIDLKAKLLSREAPEPEKPKREEKTTQRMRGARTRARAWQGYCRRGWW